LQAAFTVEPSPKFLARVRTTIAKTPSPSMTARSLTPAAMIACTVLVAISVSLPREDPRLEQDSPVTAGPDTTNVLPGATNLPPSTTTVRSPNARTAVVPTFRSARPTRSAQQPSATTSELPLPEVIIAADDVEAFLQFVSGARDLRFIASFDETPVSTPWVITELSIAPIAVGVLESAPAHDN
jgi:hypothetical protein